MNKRQARALLTMKTKIEIALDKCLSQLSHGDRTYAENYWAAHIRQSLNGYSYGSAPIVSAERALDETR